MLFILGEKLEKAVKTCGSNLFQDLIVVSTDGAGREAKLTMGSRSAAAHNIAGEDVERVHGILDHRASVNKKTMYIVTRRSLEAQLAGRYAPQLVIGCLAQSVDERQHSVGAVVLPS